MGYSTRKGCVIQHQKQQEAAQSDALHSSVLLVSESFVIQVDNFGAPIFTWKVFLVKWKGIPMDQNNKTRALTASIAETAIYTMLLSQALFEILEEKGLVTRAEVTERMKKLESETANRMWHSNDGKPNLSG